MSLLSFKFLLFYLFGCCSIKCIKVTIKSFLTVSNISSEKHIQACTVFFQHIFISCGTCLCFQYKKSQIQLTLAFPVMESIMSQESHCSFRWVLNVKIWMFNSTINVWMFLLLVPVRGQRYKYLQRQFSKYFTSIFKTMSSYQ
jgi:hypothetical protein